MEQNKSKATITNSEQTDSNLSEGELKKVSGGNSAQQQTKEKLESSQENSTTNLAHQRRLEQIDNPELAQ